MKTLQSGYKAPAPAAVAAAARAAMIPMRKGQVAIPCLYLRLFDAGPHAEQGHVPQCRDTNNNNNNQKKDVQGETRSIPFVLEPFSRQIALNSPMAQGARPSHGTTRAAGRES